MSPVKLMSAIPALLLLVICLPAQAASIKVKPPTAAEISQIRERQRALVLFKARASIDGKPVLAAREYDGNKLLRYFLARMDDLAAPQRVFPSSPSMSAATEGWGYLVLPPGIYYLLVVPPGLEQNPPATAYDASSARYGRLTQYEFTPGRGGFYSPELGTFVFRKPPPDFRPLQGFWFQVPAGAQVVNLGSLSIACKGGRGLFGSLIDSCSDFELGEDQQAAEQLAVSSVPGVTVESMSLVPLGARRQDMTAVAADTLPVSSGAVSGLASAFTGAELTPWATVQGTGQAFALYNLLAIGGELLQKASGEQRARQRSAEMQDCVDRLAATIVGLDLAASFGHAVASDPSPTAAGEQPVAPHRWSVTMPVVRLRESGQPQQLALELGLDVRLESVDGGRVAYYGLLLYAPELPAQNPHTPRSPLYARIVPERAPSHPTSEWCGPDGPALLAAQVSDGLRHIAAQVLWDLR